MKNKLTGKKLRPCKNLHKLTDKINERVKWCRKILKFLERNKDNIVISDETYLMHEEDDHGKQWTLPGIDYIAICRCVIVNICVIELRPQPRCEREFNLW